MYWIDLPFANDEKTREVGFLKLFPSIDDITYNTKRDTETHKTPPRVNHFPLTFQVCSSTESAHIQQNFQKDSCSCSMLTIQAFIADFLGMDENAVRCAKRGDAYIEFTVQAYGLGH